MCVNKCDANLPIGHIFQAHVWYALIDVVLMMLLLAAYSLHVLFVMELVFLYLMLMTCYCLLGLYYVDVLSLENYLCRLL